MFKRSSPLTPNRNTKSISIHHSL